MIAGHLQEKKGYFYVVLNYKDTNDKRRTKWIPTGYPAEERNRSKAQTFLKKQQKTFVIPTEEEATAEKEQEEDSLDSPEILFADYLANWLQIARSTIAITTYSSYSSLIKSAIDPWFRKKGVTLKELNARNIQEFYTVMLTRVKPNTVIHYHAIIHRALKYAVRTDLIAINPADKVDRPRKNGFMASFYSKEEMNRLFDACEGTLIEVPVKMAAFYGLRRSEVMGLKWDAIDFEKDTVSIQHTVTSCMIDGKFTPNECTGADNTIISAITTDAKKAVDANNRAINARIDNDMASAQREAGRLEFEAKFRANRDYFEKAKKDFDPDRPPQEGSPLREQWESTKRIHEIFK